MISAKVTYTMLLHVSSVIIKNIRLCFFTSITPVKVCCAVRITYCNGGEYKSKAFYYRIPVGINTIPTDVHVYVHAITYTKHTGLHVNILPTIYVTHTSHDICNMISYLCNFTVCKLEKLFTGYRLQVNL